MYKKVLFIFILVFNCVNGQINKGAFDEYLYFVNQARPLYDDVLGSPYLFDNFVIAKINEFEKLVEVRFNIYSENVEFKDSNGSIRILSPEKSYKFSLKDSNNSIYETLDYLDENGNDRSSFFKLINRTEDYKLYVKHNIKYLPKKIATSGFEQNQPAKFVKANDTFFVMNLKSSTKKLTRISTKKELKSFFKEKENGKELMKFLKSEKIKLNKEEDIIKLLNHFSKNN